MLSQCNNCLIFSYFSVCGLHFSNSNFVVLKKLNKISKKKAAAAAFE